MIRTFPLIALLCTPLASAGTVSQTFKGVTKTNWGVTGAAATEFPTGTAWTLLVEWDSSSDPSYIGTTQSQYLLTKLTLTLQGVSGPWTTSSVPGKASFTLNQGIYDQIQFTSGWGPADHTNQALKNLAPQSINLTLKDPGGTKITALTPAPSRINLSDWSLLPADSYLKFYLNETGSVYILGEIQVQPEIEVQQPKGSALIDGKGSRNFGKVAPGSTGAAKSFVIRNTGSSTLSKLRISKSGKNKAEFLVGALPKSSLAAGQSMTFKVRFSPKAKGPHSAKLVISSNDSDENPFDIPVNGVGR